MQYFLVVYVLFEELLYYFHFLTVNFFGDVIICVIHPPDKSEQVLLAAEWLRNTNHCKYYFVGIPDLI